MFGAYYAKEKGHILYNVFTEILAPIYGEVLNDHQIDEVVKEHFNIADAYIQQQSPSKQFLGYSGLVINIVPHNPLRGNGHIPLQAVIFKCKARHF